jgi:hypothetical protein
MVKDLGRLNWRCRAVVMMSADGTADDHGQPWAQRHPSVASPSLTGQLFVRVDRARAMAISVASK